MSTITKNDLNAHTSGRVDEYRAFIVKHLKEQGAISVTDLEALIFEHFSPQFTEEDKSWVHHLKSRKKTVLKWRNDIHWARAILTRQLKTMTLAVGNEEWLAYRPEVQGAVFGKSLVLAADANTEIAKHVSKLAQLRDDKQRLEQQSPSSVS